ncbi:sensor histidine kinase [Streptacidiphilus rugosus]|uniref:sensor histidine kinase n=1 Tax=Streptacidiphilus rugosus TaxID=405783 RepID=UPI00056C4C4E|nr:histidine kinase [Streptacidiphilus rugosus]
MESWTDWPSPEALSRDGLAAGRRWVGLIARVAGLGAAVWITFAGHGLTMPQVMVALLVTVVGLLAFWGFMSSAPRMSLPRSLTWLGLVYVMAILAALNHAPVIGLVLMCLIAVRSVQTLPLVVAAPATLLGAVVFLIVSPPSIGHWENLLSILGLGVLGYVTRLDWESRAQTQRALVQERALRTAEAESAALAERARIAREIHDVLAHSLSAQLVHLEAARLMLDAGAEREAVRERIVAARGMAKDGLDETRAALSALRGEFTPVGEFLAKLADAQEAELEVVGTPRPLTAEAGVTVRRTAQEALTNVRKHAPGAQCTVRLSYLDGTVELEVVNRGGLPEGELAAELAGSGSGLGLLGMRERAELLGGALEAGPTAEGFRVLLRVPC